MLIKELTDTQRLDTAVEFISVTKTFRRSGRKRKETVNALDNISFTVKKGEFTAYAGPNGAGKSTTMKLISGILLPTSGKISVFGLSPEKDRIKLMKRIGVLFGNRTELWGDHPVRQSFEWKKAVWDIPEKEYKKNLDMAIELLALGPILGTFARELSLGQRMRADIAMLLLHSPELILLDEPTLGLDVTAKRQMIEFLKTANRENGITVIVTSHDMDDLEEMAKRIIMISDGKIAYDGSFDGLRNLSGDTSRLILTADKNTAAPNLPCRLIKSQDGIFEYEVNTDTLPANELLKKISDLENIKGIEIKKSPIEQVIDTLYKSWT